MLHCQSPASPEHQPRARAEDDLPATLLESPVLIVEDEAMIAWTVESLLEELGFTRIAIAASGETAIAEAARVAPQLIVSDINLGPARMDGVAAAIEMVARAAAAVVFVTGHASAEARGRIERGVPGAVVLSKPVAAEALRRAIHAATAPGTPRSIRPRARPLTATVEDSLNAPQGPTGPSPFRRTGRFVASQ